MSLERAHAEFFNEGKGPVVVGGGLVDVRGSTMRRNISEEAQGMCLVTTFLLHTGERQRTFGEGLRLLRAISQKLRLPQSETNGRLVDFDYHFRCNGLLHRLREQRHGVGDASAQDICRT